MSNKSSSSTSSISKVMDQIIHKASSSLGPAQNMKPMESREKRVRIMMEQKDDNDDIHEKKKIKQSHPSTETGTSVPPISHTKVVDGVMLLEQAEMRLASSSTYHPKVLQILSTPSAASSSAAASATAASVSSSSTIVSLVKQATLSLEKAITKNQLLRGQHADNPSLYMESELNLHDEITALQALAALEDDNDDDDDDDDHITTVLSTCYKALIDIGTLSSLVSLIQSHENVDIGMAVIQLMVELIDPSLIQNKSNTTQLTMGYFALTFIQLGGLDGLIHNLLPRFILSSSSSTMNRNSSQSMSIQDLMDEEGQILEGIEYVLCLIENLLELDQMGILQLSYQHNNTNQQGNLRKQDDENKQQDQSSNNNNFTINNSLSFQSIVHFICTQSVGLISFLLLLMMDDTDEPINSNNNNNTTYIFASLSSFVTTTLRVHVSEVLVTIFQHEDFNKSILDFPTLATLSSSSTSVSILALSSSTTPTNLFTNKKESHLLSIDGMETLLLFIAKFRKMDPTTQEECECLENIVDCLATTLWDTKNIQLFLQRQGLQLMLRCIREKVHSGGGALKIIDFCLSNYKMNIPQNKNHHHQNIQDKAIMEWKGTNSNPWDTFVDVGGLKTLFPLFMGKGTAIPKPAICTDAGNLQVHDKKSINSSTTTTRSSLQKRAIREKRDWILGIESHTIHILYSLFLHLDEKSPQDAKNRLLSKFLEEEYEKCDRLIELCQKYDIKMQQAEYNFYRSKEAEELELMEQQEDLELLALKAKLNAGGELFYKLCVILAFVAVGSKRCHEHILGQLKTQNYSIRIIKSAINEYLSILDSDQSTTLLNFQLFDKL